MQAMMVVMVREGAPEPERNWIEIASFTVGQVYYSLKQAPSLFAERNVNYVIEFSVQGIVIRRAKVGMILYMSKGLGFEFFANFMQGVMEWFLSTKNSYLLGGEDWFTISLAVGEWFYIGELQALVATAYEIEQRRKLLITPEDKLENIFPKQSQDEDKPIHLDDIWNTWGEDNE